VCKKDENCYGGKPKLLKHTKRNLYAQHQNLYHRSSGIQRLFALIGRLSHGELVAQIEYLKTENQILRGKLGRRVTTTPGEKARIVKFGLAVGGKIRDLISIADYTTFRRWVKIVIEGKIKTPAKRGRPRATTEEIRALVVRMARENLGWGYGRISRELMKLGIKVAPNTVKLILVENGIDPVSKRSKDETWDEFVKRHFETLWACDFFTKTVWTMLGPKTVYVLFFIHVQTRQVHIAGITARPRKAWVVRNVKRIAHIFDTGKTTEKILIRDSDAKFPKAFDEALKEYGVKAKRIPFKSPNLNPYAEGWVGTVKRECLNHFIVLGIHHLKYLVEEYVKYYNTVRPHSKASKPELKNRIADSEIKCDSRLGGVVRHYYRA